MMVVDHDHVNGSYESQDRGHQRRHEPPPGVRAIGKSLPTTTPTSGGIRSCKGTACPGVSSLGHLQRHRLASRLYLGPHLGAPAS